MAIFWISLFFLIFINFIDFHRNFSRTSLKLFIVRMIFIGFRVIIKGALCKGSVVWLFLALVALKGVELWNILMTGWVYNFIKFHWHKTLFAINFYWICYYSYTNRTCWLSVLLGLFIKPSFETGRVEEMATKGTNINHVIKANCTLVIIIDQVRSNFINFIIPKIYLCAGL